MTNVIQQQFAFLAELDKLKSVLRQTTLIDRSRKENSAEHSWHLAMFALTLQDHAADIDIMLVIKMLLLHDIVEIDAGDVPFFTKGIDKAAMEKAEQLAAQRIFGLLPDRQAEEMAAIWQEFETAETPSACFAKALDRLQPLLINTLTDGGTWNDFSVTEDQAMNRYGAIINAGSPTLWREASKLVAAHFARKRADEAALASGAKAE